MWFDILTWISKAYVLRQSWIKQIYSDGTIQSSWFQTHKLKIGILSKFLVACLPFGVLFLAHLIGWYDINLVSDIIIWVLAWAEFISSIQNIIVVRTWKQIEEVDAITYVLRTILWITRKAIDKALSKDQS